MTEIKNFRKAFRGFHREDVVAYITYLHNHYNAQIEQLNAQLQQVQPQDLDLATQLKEAKERCQQLEKELAEVKETNFEQAKAAGGPAGPKRVEKKVGRNDPCPCGSGKKYKQCCGKEA